MKEHVLTLPDLGDFDEVEVIEILVEPGDRIAEGDSVVTLESEKAAMELPAQAAGVVRTLHVKLGSKVAAGAPLLTLETSEPAASAKAASPRPPAAGVARATEAGAPPGTPPEKRTREQGMIRAGPSVRRFARELGVDLRAVRGSGPKERILERDVKDFVRRTSQHVASPPLPAVRSTDFSRFGPVKIVEPDRIQSAVAERVRRAWWNVPHVTQHDEADVTDLEDRRKQLAAAGEKIKLTLLAFLIKALALSLRGCPKFNVAFDDKGRLIQKQYCHVSVAMDVPGGLFAPVVRNADRKDVLEIAGTVNDLARRARAGRLAAADLQGGCITISNQGGIGGSAFTPIVNAPETAILGVSRARIAPLWDGRAFVPRLMLPLDLSYDHRVVNGADAARFLDGYCRLLSETHRLLPDAR